MPRVDALDKVTGAALYSADIVLPRMLHGRVLRSPYPHAMIRRLDVSKAQALEGVMAVITAADVPGDQDEMKLVSSEIPRLAKKKVLFEGQPIAAVAAINPYIAEDALSLIEVDYEEVTPLLDVLENMKPDAPLIHPNIYTKGLVEEETTPSNISKCVKLKCGDIEAGFKEADLVLENTFRTQTVHQGYLEPMSAVASVDASDKVTVWTSSQGIFHVREILAEFLNLPLSRIKVVPVEVGGAFGGKNYQLTASLCALLACRTKHPVKMVMTREEVLKASRPAHASLITIKTGVTKEGYLTATSVAMIYDQGAFPEIPGALRGALTGLGLYRIPNLKAEAYEVLTNKVPSGAYRAPGAPQAHFAVESQMDLIARALGIDPLQLRIRNAVTAGDPTPYGDAFPKIGFKETLEKMAEYLTQRGKLEGENRGRGIACGYWPAGFCSCAAHVNVNADGSVNLLVGSVDLTGSRTSLAQIVAEEFGITFEDVSVVTGDTETAPYSAETVGSRITYSMGMAVYRACQDAKAQLAHHAALLFGVQPTDIKFANGCFQVKGTPQKSISFVDLTRNHINLQRDDPITGRGSAGTTRLPHVFTVQTADIEVDKETGKVKILSYAAAQDVGLAINPILIEGQIQGGIAQGIGWALMENYVFDRGVMQNTTLLDYRMPTAADMPFMETLLVECSSDTGTYGMRPVGEPPIISSIATIANAIHSAVGVRLKELPMSPEALFWSLMAQSKSR